jgi:membrane protease YdiL (CAAX protease family)
MTAEVRAQLRFSRLRLWAEFLALFLGVPVAMAAFFGQYSLFAVITLLAFVAAGLLAITPGFSFRELRKGPVLGEWRLILAFLVTAGPAALLVAWTLVPERVFLLATERTELWLLIMVFYPIASAAPQELIFRPLFFRRYGALFPNDGVAVLANAVAFGIGHLFFMNAITIGLTMIVGVVFALAYLRHRSFLLAVVLHGLAGQIVFTVGLGVFFYHGAVGTAP